jgi:microcystin-dependent protein
MPKDKEKEHKKGISPFFLLLLSLTLGIVGGYISTYYNLDNLLVNDTTTSQPKPLSRNNKEVTVDQEGSLSFEVISPNISSRGNLVFTPQQDLVISKGNLKLSETWADISGSNLQIYGEGNTDIYLQPNGGQVGIGTTNAQYTLHVLGDVGFSGELMEGIVPWERLTDIVSVQTGQGLEGGGQLTEDITISLSDTAVNQGTYGSSEEIPIITVNSRGQITNATIQRITIPDSVEVSNTGNSDTTAASTSYVYSVNQTLSDEIDSLTDTNDYLDSVTFNTSTGVLTLGRSGALVDLTQSLDGRYLVTYTETDPIWLSEKASYFNLSEDETVTGIPSFNGGVSGSTSPFTVDSNTVVSNLNSDLLDGEEGAYYLDNTDTNEYVDSVSFNTSTGELTVGRTGALGDLTADIDNRYLQLTGGTMTGDLMFSGATRYIGTSDSNNFVIKTNDSDRLTVSSTGQVGVGKTPSSQLDVAGDINFTGNITEDGVEIFTGVIAAFNGSCPTGWTEYTDAQGRAIIGAGQGSGLTNRVLGSTGGEETHVLTESEMPSHTHIQNSHRHRSSTMWASFQYAPDWPGGGGASIAVSSGNYLNTGYSTATNQNTGGDAAHNNMQPYIALTYCQKQTGSDYAEWIPSNEDLKPATIVSIDLSKDETITASSKEYDSNVVGIVTTQPGWVIGEESNQSEAMALSGRVPVKVSLKNGNIQRGDPITTSSIKGVGMKATKTGPIIGKAMEELNNESNLYECTDSKTNQTEKCGTITVFVNPTMHIQESFVLGTTDSKKGFLNGLAEVIGQITGTIIKTSINVLGATDSKVSTEDILSRIERLEENQQSQALILKETEDGSIELLGGKIIVEGDGTVAIKKLKLEKGYTAGKGIILSGDTRAIINTKAVIEDSIISITPRTDTKNKQLYVTDIVEGESFYVNIDEAIEENIEFDWFIVDS